MIFCEDLKKLAVKIKNFSSFGDIFLVEQYLEQALEIDQWLGGAENTIEGFNTEEEAFGWEVTDYPLRMDLINELKPYIQLYSSAVDFEKMQE